MSSRSSKGLHAPVTGYAGTDSKMVQAYPQKGSTHPVKLRPAARQAAATNPIFPRMRLAPRPARRTRSWLGAGARAAGAEPLAGPCERKQYPCENTQRLLVGGRWWRSRWGESPGSICGVGR